MILSKKVRIRSNSKNKKHFLDLGYDVPKQGKYFDVSVKDLTNGSKALVGVMCNICGEIKKDVEYKEYCRNTKNNTIEYACCNKCAVIKRENTNKKLYGKKYYSQRENFNEEVIKINQKKFGVNYYSQTEECKEKVKETNYLLYGVEYYQQTEEFLTRYVRTMNNKYGVDNYSYTNDFVEKCRKYWGYDNPLNKENFDDFTKLVRNKTKTKHKKLKEDWDGYDYYTGEYIKDNYDLYKPNDPQYPNIDHKISIKYGFENGYSVEELSDISNLCFTTRKNNLKKSSKKYNLKIKKSMNGLFYFFFCLLRQPVHTK